MTKIITAPLSCTYAAWMLTLWDGMYVYLESGNLLCLRLALLVLDIDLRLRAKLAVCCNGETINGNKQTAHFPATASNSTDDATSTVPVVLYNRQLPLCEPMMAPFNSAMDANGHESEFRNE